jgi:hypothetical protein
MTGGKEVFVLFSLISGQIELILAFDSPYHAQQ